MHLFLFLRYNFTLSCLLTRDLIKLVYAERIYVYREKENVSVRTLKKTFAAKMMIMLRKIT